jgi:hypothetical protein
MVPSRTRICHVFTFPFWVHVDRKAPWRTCDARLETAALRVYPLFRSAPANYYAAPSFNPTVLPYLAEVQERRPLKVVEVGWSPILVADGGPTVQTQFSPNWQDPPRMFPMDSLRVDQLGDAKGLPARLQPREFTRRLLARLRHRTGQWWILREVAALSGFERATFDIDNDGRPLSNPYTMQEVHTGFGFELPVDLDVWRLSVEETIRGVETPAFATSLLDAYFHLASSAINQCIISAAIGCEQATEATFERVWVARNPTTPFKRSRLMQGWDLPKHLTRDLERLCKRSLSAERPADNIDIEELWRARGAAAHGGEASVAKERAEEVLAAAQRLVNWLQGIQP